MGQFWRDLKRDSRLPSIQWRDPKHITYLIMLAGLIVLIIKTSYEAREGDFIQFYRACELFKAHLNPYASTAYPTPYLYGFPYPPLAIYLTFFPSLFSLSAAIHIWDVFCLLLYMASLYLLADLIWGTPPSFIRFVQIAVACTIAPCYWSFWEHHMIVPILFSAITALWLLVHKKHVFIAGLLTGIMLMKPHLTFLFALIFLIENPDKKKFILGILMVFLFQAFPFLNTYRPVSDLMDMAQAAENYKSHVYYADEQSLTSLLFKWTLARRYPDLMVARNEEPGTLADPKEMERLNRYKGIAFLIGNLGFILLLIHLRSKHRMKASTCFCWASLIGVLFSFYSHCHDGALLVPLTMLLLHDVVSARHWELASTTPLFFFNFGLAYALPFGLNPGITKLVYWNHLAFGAGIYGLLILIASISVWYVNPSRFPLIFD